MSYSLVSEFMKLVDEGKKGNNIGLSTGLPKLDKIIYGVQRRSIVLIGGTSGSAKTTATLFSYVYQPIKQMLGNPRLKILYLSLEMSKETLLAKLLSLYIMDTFNEVVQYKEIFSLDSKISDEKYELIKKSLHWLTTVENHLIIYDKPINAVGVDNLIKGILSTYGKFVEQTKYSVTFIPNYENPYFITIIDHISLISPSPGNTLKQEIDDVCAKLIWLRNVASITGVIVQQVNRGNQNVDRKKMGLTELTMADFADSSGTQNAAETIIAINHPFREKLDESRGYKISEIKDRFRLFSIIKGRYGQSELAFGVNFHGEIGYFTELPLPEQIKDYKPYLDPKIIYDKSDLNKKEEEPKKQIQGFSFSGDNIEI